MTESDQDLHVLAFAGSLRRGSFNRGLVRAAVEEAPDGMVIETFELDSIPLFNADVEADGDPEPVTAFKGAIQASDAVLIAAPEYNQGMTGVLKNALDWGSRPPREAPLPGKPAAVIGASPGRMGTVRGQMQVRQTLLAIGCHLLPRPEVMVSQAGEKFDADGNLVDAETREYVRKLLVALASWTQRMAD